MTVLQNNARLVGMKFYSKITFGTCLKWKSTLW